MHDKTKQGKFKVLHDGFFDMPQMVAVPNNPKEKVISADERAHSHGTV